ncbi:MAG TPA: excinuclease ABC subunit UvrA [Candidatus Veblenbacteria bacterium]|uniref:UvrABC system protein A n=2 Tax=Candidatus Vebleniibacteriota TaxID=1817921 RepID=A0A1G2Q2Z3_9BACT|nr:MAG: excinuclease ABC subunit A [Candidatus Veblenbacteria bacterium RIFOXYA2_FULL_43_9]HBH17318.1 excinuclease ABC subunit UvrA [Candidatus Veblenbacteria bacterium]HBZ36738.1 excinuclease ABC subunit UvrA [Candidatus Veblenbacteria bacterium]
MPTDNIVIRGARVHNLKNISLNIPRNKLVVITGLSGSGKSSLAFDTIYAEGQRRYIESLSAYARQFLGVMDKPDVDQIDGLSPAISIDQKSTSHNPRSTVGTVTEIYDYLRLLYARVGIPHCPSCGREVTRQSVDQIVTRLQDLPQGTQIALLAPVVRDQKGEHKNTVAELKKAGYVRLRFDGKQMSIEEAEDLKVDKQKKHTVEVVVDRLIISREPDDITRLHDSLETALDLGDGLVTVTRQDTGENLLFSEHFSCPHCHVDLPNIEPRSFSFNSPHGACPTCTGLGTRLEIDPDLVVPNKKLSIAEGAIRPWSRTSANQTWYYRIMEAVAREYGFSLNQPVSKLTPAQFKILFYGTGSKNYNVNAGAGEGGKVRAFYTTYEGVIPNLERRYRETESDYMRAEIERYMRVWPCSACEGKRLKPEVLAVTVANKNMAEIVIKSVIEASEFFAEIEDKGKLTVRDIKIAKTIIKEIRERLSFLTNVGLGYLTLDRAAASLSGGEAQRIRLATQIGSSLVGVIYILDEPSIGLHQRDNEKLITTLKRLRDLGNTVIVVEHDRETMLAADELIDIGPGAGKHGGEVVSQGTPLEVAKDPGSLTGRYLSGKLSIPVPTKKRNGNGKSIVIQGAQEFNLKNITVDIPLGKFVCITGVSGSGKSTLMTDILSRALAQHFYNAKDLPGKHKAIKGLEHVDKVITIDQSPIGRTPRSNPATYTGVFTPIRDLFSQIPEAKIRGYDPGRFSFNVKGGRCEACEGDGLVRIEMHFLPDVYVECEECHGRRYNSQALEIHYKGKNISDVLEMTSEEAMNFFEKVPAIHQKLKVLCEVGLGYIHLGQSATTLSGGEAQRIKLATELSRRSTGRTLYILDEPTTGLHFDDVKRLLQVLSELVDRGNTVLVIEHNMDVIKCADWVIDLGPEGGDKGGELVAVGTPQEIIKSKRSYTGEWLKKVL